MPRRPDRRGARRSRTISPSARTRAVGAGVELAIRAEVLVGHALDPDAAPDAGRRVYQIPPLPRCLPFACPNGVRRDRGRRRRLAPSLPGSSLPASNAKCASAARRVRADAVEPSRRPASRRRRSGAACARATRPGRGTCAGSGAARGSRRPAPMPESADSNANGTTDLARTGRPARAAAPRAVEAEPAVAGELRQRVRSGRRSGLARRGRRRRAAVLPVEPVDPERRACRRGGSGARRGRRSTSARRRRRARCGPGPTASHALLRIGFRRVACRGRAAVAGRVADGVVVARVIAAGVEEEVARRRGARALGPSTTPPPTRRRSSQLRPARRAQAVGREALRPDAGRVPDALPSFFQTGRASRPRRGTGSRRSSRLRCAGRRAAAPDVSTTGRAASSRPRARRYWLEV